MSLNSSIKSLLKKKVTFLMLIASLFLIGTMTTSCGSNKEGCPINERSGQPNKKGQYSSKKGKSNLFPKKVRKKLGG